MISVLIPVFNCDISDLVFALKRQLSEAEVRFEIVIIDDGSAPFYKDKNSVLNKQQYIHYSEFAHNKGRIAIRNELMKKAAFDWLLFLDADSLVISDEYIKTYVSALNGSADVIVGGRVYDKEKPSNCRLALHWTYGSQREVQQPQRRSLRPYAGFMSNNFLIKKQVFQKLQLTEALSGYGHEDTWMGVQLEKFGAIIRHIDNPVLHNGIEETNVFIDKSFNGLHNLQTLQKILGEETLRDHVKLFAAYYRFKRLGILPILNGVITIIEWPLLKNLRSCNPSLFLFDLYRLHYFAQLSKKDH